MKFMKTEGEGDITLQEGKLTEREAEEWKKEYLTEKKEKTETLKEKWVEDYSAPSGSGSKYQKKSLNLFKLFIFRRCFKF